MKFERNELSPNFSRRHTTIEKINKKIQETIFYEAISIPLTLQGLLLFF